MPLPIDRESFLTAAATMPRRDAIVAAFQRAVVDGRLAPGARLPTVRQLSAELGVSGATVVAGYRLLRDGGWIRGEVGRGTFVAGSPSQRDGRGGGAPLADRAVPAGPPRLAPWRRRAVLASADRLRSRYPAALDCTSGKPDPALLLTDLFRRAWRAALDETAAADLQYASPEPVSSLAAALRPRLARDGVPVAGTEFVVGSSAQQLMVLSLGVAAGLSGGTPRRVAVEEPGYQTVFDAFEQTGHRLVGMAVDAEGVVPDALAAALAAGAQAVLFTPRAQNPLGVSWTVERRQALARVLAAHPRVVAIEDDQFADLARERPGSLLNDGAVAERVVYVRSFAKAVAPDIRVAVAVARPRLRAALAEAKSLMDGWSSRLGQRGLAHLLADPELDEALAGAGRAYAARRLAATEVLVERLHPAGGRVSGGDGLNIWVRLPPGAEAAEVVERAAALGVLLAPGEPFFIRPGHADTIRMSVSALSVAEAVAAAERFAEAALTTASAATAAIPI